MGRAWQHFFLNPDYNEFFWNQTLFGDLAEWVWGVSWNEFLTTTSIQNQLDKVIAGIGALFLLGGISVFSLKDSWARVLLFIATALLLPFAWLHFVGNVYNWAMLFEFSAQLFAPILLWVAVRKPEWNWVLFAKVVIAITFTCHGLYAAGIYPVPQKFIGMTIRVFECSKDTALVFLKIAGWLDFVAATCLFIPNKNAVKRGLWYMVIWGFITAFTRIYSNFYYFDAWHSLHQWAYAFFIRAPHFLLPLALLFHKKESA